MRLFNPLAYSVIVVAAGTMIVNWVAPTPTSGVVTNMCTIAASGLMVARRRMNSRRT